MAGLLDFLNTPEGQLGLGLLGAAGPTSDPNQTGFGQRIQAGFGYAQQQQDNAMKRRYMEAQTSNFQSEIEQRNAAFEQQQRKQSMLEKLLGGSSQAMGATNLVNDALPPGMQIGAQSAIPARSGIENASLDNLAQLKALGGVDLTDIRKLAQPTPLANGWVRDFNGKERYMADPTKGFSFDNGKVSPTPGFTETNNAIVGGAAGATEDAKAARDLVQVDQSDGTKKWMTRARAAQMFGGGNQPQQIPSFGNSQPTPQGMAAIQSDIQSTGNPNPTLNFNRPTLGVTKNPVDAARDLKQTEADVMPTQQRQSAIASGNYLSQVLDMAIKHPGRETATGLSGTLDPRNYMPGTDAKNFGAVNDQIKGSAFMQAYQSLKGGGQITEVEGKKATDAIVRLNTAQSDSAFLEALKEFKGIVDNANTRMGGGKTDATGKNPTFQSFGYKTPESVIRDAQNTIMRNPSAKAEVLKRLQAMGLSLPGMPQQPVTPGGSW